MTARNYLNVNKIEMDIILFRSIIKVVVVIVITWLLFLIVPDWALMQGGNTIITGCMTLAIIFLLLLRKRKCPKCGKLCHTNDSKGFSKSRYYCYNCYIAFWLNN